MATSATLILCSSLTTKCKISHHINPPNPLPKTLFLSKPKTHISLALSTAPTFMRTLKSSESEAPVIEAEYSTPEPMPGTSEIVEVAAEAPKREEVFAVVMIGSRQYIVIPGRYIYVQRLKGANANDKITLNKVLLVGTRTTTYIGKPVVTNAAVHAVVEEQGLDPKVIVFKYKKKKNYKRTIGHRQLSLDNLVLRLSQEAT